MLTGPRNGIVYIHVDHDSHLICFVQKSQEIVS